MHGLKRISEENSGEKDFLVHTNREGLKVTALWALGESVGSEFVNINSL